MRRTSSSNCTTSVAVNELSVAPIVEGARGGGLRKVIATDPSVAV